MCSAMCFRYLVSGREARQEGAGRRVFLLPCCVSCKQPRETSKSIVGAPRRGALPLSGNTRRVASGSIAEF